MAITLETSLHNRQRLIDAVRVEIIGPSRIHEKSTPFNATGNTVLTYEELKKNYYWSHCGIQEEILQNEFPSRRYSAGLLYPHKSKQEEIVTTDNLSIVEENKQVLNEKLINNEFKHSKYEVNESDEERNVANNDYLPSSLGFTCRVDHNSKKMKIAFSGARYLAHNIIIKQNNAKKTWWLRETIKGEYILDFTKYANKFDLNNIELPLFNLGNEEVKDFLLTLNIRCRISQGAKLLTVTATNRTKTKRNSMLSDESMIFQAELMTELMDGTAFLNYPKHYQRSLPMTESEAKDELLYRHKINYAFGHGCSTTWESNTKNVTKLSTTFLPNFETTSMTPDVEIEKDGKKQMLSIRMFDLANAKSIKELEHLLSPLIQGYKEWIQSKHSEIIHLENELLQKAAYKNLDLCKESLKRMEKGLEHLRKPEVLKAFLLANKAMLLQQVNGKKIRTAEFIDTKLVYKISIKETVKSMEDLEDSKNKWRAFQIAFFLMSIDSIVNEESLEREIVDLIWFPTGGGKTEAYLAVAAFQMFYRRLLNPQDAGVDVIMRYTLRLLTADQFQRSSRLICAMEYLRKLESVNLGTVPFSIGMWVGGNTSPNSNKEAIIQYNMMTSRQGKSFLISRCPWCGSEIGKIPMKESNSKSKAKSVVIGYRPVNKEILTYCPDEKCHFHNELPIYFVDQIIYEKRPTFLIGTIDKFVQLTRVPKARSLFGIGANGEQLFTPPNLIIQDELHLISGPLGTLSGLFETVIEQFCTKYVNGKYIKPKIISATATIKEFETQAEHLFGRSQAKLFPSPALDIDDSFFATVARESDGTPSPGRKYVGIFTSNVGIMMAEVKTFAAILQEANELPEDERDPYWTLLAFYNSLRDLGTGINLCNMDIPTYMSALKTREDYDKYRNIREPLELTSRKQSQEIAKIIDTLKEEYVVGSKNKPLDVCLASNIIEVGVDIDRLSVMAVVGQPKMTAQYIQVTGRVGRRWMERPGVIFTIYSNRNSRDKSHFEHFNEYHQRLYAQVETTSVTPFSDASLERGLSAVMIAFIRQRFSNVLANSPDAEAFAQVRKSEAYYQFKKGLAERLKLIDPEQVDVFKRVFGDIEKLILSGDFINWVSTKENTGLMYNAGDPVAKKLDHKSIGVINSLRSVDAESKGKILRHIKENVILEQVEEEDDWGDLL